MPGTDAESRLRRTGSASSLRILKQAERLVASGDLDLAVERLERGLSHDGDGYTCALRIAEIHRMRQRWQDALLAAERAATLSPSRIAAYELALEIALESGETDRIERSALALIKMQPRCPLAYEALSGACMQRGDIDAAMRAAAASIRLDIHNTAHRYRHALLLQHKGEIARAVREFGLTLRMEPEGPYALAAREALEVLDTVQLNQIATLAMEDAVFRVKLTREPAAAAAEKGFELSEMGAHVLSELAAYSMPHLPEPPRVAMYN